MEDTRSNGRERNPTGDELSTDQVKTAQEVFSRGKQLEQEAKIAEAIACYQQATELHPDYYFYYYKLGTLLRQQEQLTLAQQAFQRAIAINSQDSWSYYALGELAASEQDLEKAIKYYQQAIVFNPDFSWSHYNLGRIYHQQQNLTAAIDCYQKSLALAGDFVWAHYFLAEAFRVTQFNEEAIVHYQEAIKLAPQCHEAYYQLGHLVRYQGQLEQAASYYQQAIKLYQDNFDYYSSWGETLIQLDRIEEAINCYEQAIALQPNNLQVYFDLATILIGLPPEQVSQYRQQAQRPTLFRVNLELGLAQVWQQQGQYNAAVECCQNAIAINPSAELPYQLLQYIPIPPTQIESVIDFYQKITALDSASPLIWGNLGDLLTNQGQIDSAINCYRQSCYYNTLLKSPQLKDLNWQPTQQVYPHFMIIGASKAGTTSLFTYLQEHPQILSPHKKEINFFDCHFDLGLAWYAAHFPAIADGKNYFTGEATPTYLYHQSSIPRIKQVCPEVKLIILLRNPVERTISEYYHAVNHGIEARSLEAIIALEQELLLNSSVEEATQNFGYLLNSIYFVQIAKWLAVFPSKNILIIQSEAFFNDTAKINTKVCNFLGISNYEPQTTIRYNVGKYSPMGNDVKQRLRDFFAPYNQELAKLLDRKFDW